MAPSNTYGTLLSCTDSSSNTFGTLISYTDLRAMPIVLRYHLLTPGYICVFLLLSTDPQSIAMELYYHQMTP